MKEDLFYKHLYYIWPYDCHNYLSVHVLYLTSQVEVEHCENCEFEKKALIVRNLEINKLFRAFSLD